jgi:acyl-CoA thioester hydrolase
MSEKQKASQRSEYKQFSHIETRWNDNDSYGHVNNICLPILILILHQSAFDSARGSGFKQQ